MTTAHKGVEINYIIIRDFLEEHHAEWAADAGDNSLIIALDNMYAICEAASEFGERVRVLEDDIGHISDN